MSMLVNPFRFGGLDLANLPDATIVAHYRADDYAAGSWPDRTANGYDLSQATGANQPTAVADGGSGFNNKPVVRFDGNDFVSRNTTPALSDPYTIVFIGKSDGTATRQVAVGSTDANIEMLGFTAAEVPYVNGGGAQLNGTSVLTEVSALVEGYINATSSAVRVDSALEASGNGGTGSRTGLIVGRRVDGNFPLDGDIAEILIVSGALTHADRAYLALYCMQRYGFEAPFPQTGAPTESADDTGVTTFAVDVDDVQAGQSVQVAITAHATGGGAITISAPDASWHEIGTETNAFAADIQTSWFVKKYDADAAATTVSFTISAAARAVAHSHIIDFWSGDSADVEIATASGASTTPNPPALAPSWGAEPTRWFAFWSGGSSGVTGYPSSYSDGTTETTSAGSADVGLSSAHRATAASSENPGSFTLTGSLGWLAATIGYKALS